MWKQTNSKSKTDLVNAVTAGVIVLIGLIDIVRYLVLGQPVALLTVIAIEILFAIAAIGAYLSKCPFLFALTAAAGFVLFVFLNNAATTLFNVLFLVQAIVSVFGCVGGGILLLTAKQPLFRRKACLVLAVLLVLSALLGGGCGICAYAGRSSEAFAHTLWAVPSVYDGAASEKGGTVEKLTYETKAYATDSRAVTKSAYVYLPHGYSEEKQYNILYLLHGTGDDEAYWLVKYDYNKTMLDNLIEKELIEPLIVVTPTFYVEEDCLDNLDLLTYSFAKELRNDLMPAAEGKYATYAADTSEQGFADSRDHRAFAGLSRGAVTMYRSAMCANFAYFSWFGAFSGSRVPMDFYEETVLSAENSSLPIHYLYLASGNFDFAVTNQIQDYKKLQKADSRLQQGVNTSFDVFPMRYHSMGNWHLALYNFLQILF